MAELVLEDFGIARGGRWLLRDLWLCTPRTGVLALAGPPEGVAALGQLLARYVAPHLTVWGSISLGGIDLRVSQPAVRVVDERGNDQQLVSEAVLAAASPSTWLRIHGAGVRGPREYVHEVLAAAQLDELMPEATCASLSVGRWARLRLALEDVRQAPLVWLDASLLTLAGAEQHEVLAAVERVAQQALVLVAGAGAAVEGLAAPILALPEVAPAREVAPGEPLTAHRLPGFRWIVPGRLAGMARPGTGLRTLEQDLDALVNLGTSVVVTLEEEPRHREALLAAGLSAWHLPIIDMRAPTLDDAWDVAARAAERMARGELVVFHCKGGVGRTGTMLACTLIARGQSAPSALELVRQQNSHYVQSREQLDFLSQFERGAP